MIKHSEFDFSYDYLRFDTTWKFEWDASNILADTRRFYPFTEEGNSRTWWFQGDKTNTVAIKNHDVTVWNPKDPWLEYEADNVEAWDTAYPENTTRYLSPGNSFIKLTNTIETVVIDNIPPDFVSDKGTEYVWIANVTGKDRGGIKESRHCSFVFRDKAGLDFKQFAIFIGPTPSEEELNEAAKVGMVPSGCVYYYSRKYDKVLVNTDLIDLWSLKIKSDGFNTYKIDFDLLYGTGPIDIRDSSGNPTGQTISADEQIEILNTQGLRVIVWDVAGNNSTYIFGACALPPDDPAHAHGIPNVIKGRRWVLIDSINDLSEIEPCVIKFYDTEPSNMIVNENQNGLTWVSVYNPNVEFRCIDMVMQLATGSLGAIDMTTYDDSTYAEDGLIKFRVININKHGSVDVEAWLETGNKNFDDMLKTSSYALESLSPWIVKDAEGRVYDIKRYVPTYLRSTDYYKFVEFFELYLNTLYTDLTKGTNISILEKIAKIGNFNDIDRLEHALVWHYAKDFGAEFDINLDTMLNLNLGFTRKDANPKQENTGLVINSRNEDDVIDILKYALKNLPMYNQVKGSEKGIVMALKMFSLSCKVINLWVKLNPTVDDKPDFVEEDRMQDFTSHFLTSRFNLELNSLTVGFKAFNDNIDSFIKFVKSVKPLIRILNLIKYTIIFEYDYYWLVNDYVHDDMPGSTEFCYRYTINWEKDSIAEMIEHARVDWNRMHAERIWFNYNADDMQIARYVNGTELTVENDPNQESLPDLLTQTSLYTLFTSYAANSNGKIGYKYSDDITYEIDIQVYDEDGTPHKELDHMTFNPKLNFTKRWSLNDCDVHMLETGFYIYPKTGELATYLAEFVKPTYYLDNYFKQVIVPKVADNYKDKVYAIVNGHITSNPKMTMIIEHVPGTEIFRCIDP